MSRLMNSRFATCSLPWQRAFYAVFLTLFGLVGQAYSATIGNNETVTITLPAQALTTDLWVDLPAGSKALNIELSNAPANVDIDLFVRYGQPFTGTSATELSSQADYHSIAADSDEWLHLTEAMAPPVKAGRWYVALVNYAQTQVSVDLTASYNSQPVPRAEIIFQFDNTANGCKIDGWNDPTPFTPVAGNNATTVGQARRNAATKAAELLAESLTSSVPIVIQGCWPDDLETSQESAVLANAGPNRIGLNYPGLPLRDVWYGQPVLERLAGTEYCRIVGGTDCNIPTITANFNPKIDTNAGLGSTRWFYGLDSTSAGNNVDFISTAMHEITHGLGFVSLVWVGEDKDFVCFSGQPAIHHTAGSKFCGLDDVFSLELVDYNGGDVLPFMELDDSQRLAAMQSRNELQWTGEEAANSERNIFRDENAGYVLMYAPATLEPGSSVSHLFQSQNPFGTSYHELMTPKQRDNLRELGLAEPMLWSVGWNPQPKSNVTIQPGMWYDRAHDGHGMVIEPVTDDLYYVLFYTYDENGNPEWMASLASVENGVFNITNNADSLIRFLYDYGIGANPDQRPHNPDPAVSGSLKIDFNASAANESACQDGVDRGDNQLAVATWQVNGTSGSWCLQPLIDESAYPSPNLEGSWWAGQADQGWGLSLVFFNDSIGVVLFYYDADGQPRWAIGTQSGFQIGQEITVNLMEKHGYARTATPVPLTETQAGTITLLLNSATGTLGQDGEIVDLDVTYRGSEGGRWQRSHLPITIGTKPAN